MSAHSGIAQLRVVDLVDSIGDKRVSPGAGVAGAVTLALAAACAAKAVAISLKHRPGSADLERSKQSLEDIGRFSLAGADRDTEAFTAFIQDHTRASVSRLIQEGDRIGRLIDVLSDLLDTITPLVASNMSGDVVAARALMDAARKIQLANLAEARAQESTPSTEC